MVDDSCTGFPLPRVPGSPFHGQRVKSGVSGLSWVCGQLKVWQCVDGRITLTCPPIIDGACSWWRIPREVASHPLAPYTALVPQAQPRRLPVGSKPQRALCARSEGSRLLVAPGVGPPAVAFPAASITMSTKCYLCIEQAAEEGSRFCRWCPTRCQFCGEGICGCDTSTVPLLPWDQEVRWTEGGIRVATATPFLCPPPRQVPAGRRPALGWATGGGGPMGPPDERPVGGQSPARR